MLSRQFYTIRFFFTIRFYKYRKAFFYQYRLKVNLVLYTYVFIYLKATIKKFWVKNKIKKVLNTFINLVKPISTYTLFKLDKSYVDES